MTKKLDKPRQEFWDTSRGFIKWCTPEELRILRIMAASEPECRNPCEVCKKALEIFEQLKPARKRFGIAKTRLSRIARDYRNSFILQLEDI